MCCRVNAALPGPEGHQERRVYAAAAWLVGRGVAAPLLNYYSSATLPCRLLVGIAQPEQVLRLFHQGLANEPIDPAVPA